LADHSEEWKNLAPASEDVRLHLLHLIGAHHGEQQFGSPVNPKTPEAMALHYIDNLDARLEMFAAGYATAKPLAPGSSTGCVRCPAISLGRWKSLWNRRRMARRRASYSNLINTKVCHPDPPRLQRGRR
ncbi:MAG TPA: hypothetical protein VGG94_06385, partial [Chthoniobacterales bacterium]